MKRSKLVEERFEECLELVFKGETVEDCVRRYPEHEAELRELLDTAIAARTALQVQPSQEFRERARQQLYAAQRERVARSPAKVGFSWNWQPRWATALAAVVLAVVAGTSTVLASTGSMPGQPLYGVKHAAESARVALTPSKSAKAEIYASLADQRVQEIVYLADTGDTARVQQVTDDLNSYLNQIAVLSGGASEQATVSSKYGGTMGAASVPSATNPPQLGAEAPATGTDKRYVGPRLGGAEPSSPDHSDDPPSGSRAGADGDGDCSRPGRLPGERHFSGASAGGGNEYLCL